MILEMQRIAVFCGEIMPQITFIYEADIGEQLLARFKSEILCHDGEEVRRTDGSLYEPRGEDPVLHDYPEP